MPIGWLQGLVMQSKNSNDGKKNSYFVLPVFDKILKLFNLNLPRIK